MSFSVFFILCACSLFPSAEVSSFDDSELVIRPLDFTKSIDTLIVEVQELWEKRGNADRRQAKKLLFQFYEQEGNYIFARLREENPKEVLAAEHQLGWVIHRLDRYTSRSFRREAGYLEKLSVKLRTCSDLLPEPPPIIEAPNEEANNQNKGVDVVPNSSMSAL
jgi:hypothetical protein